MLLCFFYVHILGNYEQLRVVGFSARSISFVGCIPIVHHIENQPPRPDRFPVGTVHICEKSVKRLQTIEAEILGSHDWYHLIYGESHATLELIKPGGGVIDYEIETLDREGVIQVFKYERFTK